MGSGLLTGISGAGVATPFTAGGGALLSGGIAGGALGAVGVVVDVALSLP